MPSEPPATSVPQVPLPAPTAGQWSVRGAITFVAMVMAGSMLATYAVSLGWPMLAAQLVARGADLPQGATQVSFASLQLINQLLQLTLLWWLVGYWHADRSQALDLRWVRLRLRDWLGIVLLLFAVKIVAAAVAGGFAPMNARKDLGPITGQVTTEGAWIIFLAAVVLAGATEELLFRGVLSRTLERTWLGFWGGAAASSAAFAALHLQYGLGGQFIVFAIGMTLSWIRRRNASVWPAIVCHAINNAVALVAMQAIT